MKRFMLGLAVPLTMIAVTAASAQDGIGLGVQVGEPTGFTGKFWTDSDRAFDVVAAWSTGSNDQFELHGDYLWHDFGLFDDTGDGALGLYYGVGGRMLFSERSDERVGVRVPVGLSYLFPKRNVEMFLEAAPTIDVVPDTDADLGAALGVHFMIR